MRPWVLLSAALALTGAGIFLFKVFSLGYPLSTAELPGTWRLELTVNVSGRGGRAVVEIPLPRTSGYQRLITEEVRSGSLRFSIGETGGVRLGRWSGNLDTDTTVSYEATIDSLPISQPAENRPAGKPYPVSVAAFLVASAGIQSDDPVIADLSRELALGRGDEVELVKDIYKFVGREIGAVDSSSPMDAVTVVREGRGNDIGRARLFCALVRFNRLPCRVMVGIPLTPGRQGEFVFWDEAYVGLSWVPYDVVARHKERLPPDRISLGPAINGSTVTTTGTKSASFQLYVQPELETYAELVRRQLSDSQGWLDRVSLLFLPMQLQNTLRTLLLVPLGALVMCVLRNIVGLRTFGMFMPMLIALALTGTGLAWGTVFLVLIIAAALFTRLAIRPLHLLLAARIAFILTLVVLLMVVLFLAGDRLGLPSGGIGAFPFVILTMIVERISISLEEEGAGNTLRRIGSTLVAVYLTYAVIHIRELQTAFLVFPEVLLVILALLVAVGNYTGYRLTEVFRFRELATPRSAPLG